MNGCYNRQGKAISAEVWSVLHSDWDYKIVKRTETKNLRISSVWLGMDYNWTGKGGPIIFETMVFNLDDNGVMLDDIWCERHRTLEETEEAHDRIVHEVMAGTFKGYSDD